MRMNSLDEFDLKDYKIGRRIADLRKDVGMTQVAFSKFLGIARNTVAQWEGGTRQPRLREVAYMAKYFGVSMDWLVFGEENDVKGLEQEE